MNRRRYLAALAGVTSLAGCSSSEDGSTPTRTRSGTTTTSVRTSATTLTSTTRPPTTPASTTEPATETTTSEPTTTEPSVEPPVSADGTVVSQVTESGVPQALTRIRLSYPAAVRVRDRSGIRTRAPIDLATRSGTTTQTLPLRSVSTVDEALVLVVAGPVTQGTTVSFADGSVTVGGYTPTTESISGPDRVTPTTGGLWFKPYRPTNPDYYLQRYYSGASIPRRDQRPTDPATVRDRLEDHLRSKAGRGVIEDGRVDELLARYDDPDDRAVFTGSDGGFNAHLMAAVLATAGTVLECAIGVLLDGRNSTNAPAKVVYEVPSGGFYAAVRFQDGRMVVKCRPAMRYDPIESLAPLLGHEALHSDTLVGIYEELIANTIEHVAYAQQLLVDPDLASDGSFHTRFENGRLLALLNSGGRNFPWPGVFDPPIEDPEARPGSTVSATSLEAIVRSNYDVPEIPSFGNPCLMDAVSEVTGTDVSGRRFSASTVRFLDDNLTLFTGDQVVALLETLELELDVSGMSARRRWISG